MSDQNLNALKINLSMDQKELAEGGLRPLSTSNLVIDYPSMSRNMANVASYQAAIQVILGVLEGTAANALVSYPDDVPGLAAWLRGIGLKFTELAVKLETADPGLTAVMGGGAPAAAATVPAVPGK